MSKTNTELLNDRSSGQLLTSIERQRRFLIRQGVQRKGCPNCGTLHNLPEAAGVEFDAFDFGNHGDNGFTCTACKRALVYILPLVGDWLWALVPISPPASTDA